jgi:hypothetical protein
MVIYCPQCERHLVDREGQLCPVCRPDPSLGDPVANFYVDTDGQLYGRTGQGWMPLDTVVF